MEYEQIKTADDLFAWSLAIRPYGLSTQQITFAKHLFFGHPQKTAAELAGYTGSSINVTASRLKSNKKIQALLTDAAEVADEDKSPTALPEEVLEVLTHEARHGDNSQARIRAAEALTRHYAASGQSRAAQKNPEEALDALLEEAKNSAAPELVVLLAVQEAIAQGVAWKPPAKYAESVLCRPELVTYLGGNAHLLEVA